MADISDGCSEDIWFSPTDLPGPGKTRFKDAVVNPQILACGNCKITLLAASACKDEDFAALPSAAINTQSGEVCFIQG